MTIYKNEQTAKAEAGKRQRRTGKPHYVNPCQGQFAVSDHDACVTNQQTSGEAVSALAIVGAVAGRCGRRR
jgi:hypothetical protein